MLTELLAFAGKHPFMTGVALIVAGGTAVSITKSVLHFIVCVIHGHPGDRCEECD